ncbi:MAG: DUF2237 domain-containing protein [Myxococcota bacterium]
MAAPTAPADQSVLGEPLQPCGTAPMTGFYRDGSCRTGPDDRGVHVVCAAVDDAFLEYSRVQGNDLITPSPRYGFPGLKEGDRWCLCAARWEEARRVGKAPPVILEATHHNATAIVAAEDLKAHRAQPR